MQGKIVYEKYYGGRDKSTTNTAWSTTKSLCSTMFGIAKEQGWADETMTVQGSVKNTRRCSSGATWQNVLTMTGTSPNIQSPRFSYDLLGTDCYNTISNFIGENNPEGLTTSAWKDKCVTHTHLHHPPAFPARPQLQADTQRHDESFYSHMHAQAQAHVRAYSCVCVCAYVRAHTHV